MNSIKLSLIVLLSGFIFLNSCNDDETTSNPDISITASNFNTQIDENPSSGDVLGTISATVNDGSTLTFEITSESAAGAFAIDANSGQLSVANASLFDFERSAVLTATITISSGDISESITASVGLNDVDDGDGPQPIVWAGSDITFTKADGANETLAENQDRITENVIITRSNDGGQIFNIASENSADKDRSPAGTEWAEGSIDDFETLDFSPFREAVDRPQDVVGKSLVLHLIEENIYISVSFTSWSRQRGGGFSYTRSTE